ncbi:MAG: hypothetical protein HQL52_03220 [Magnetococcales bacterium]|nr:hypothetical protein [Magnetococcales bacterium]
MNGCGAKEEAPPPLPTETADVVVKRFYELISEAQIRGGSLPIREAFKLIDSESSQISQAKFVQIVKRYPSGFQIQVVDTKVSAKEGNAAVTISYKMPSMFGDGYDVQTDVLLKVDKASNSWKIDFTGETDDQDPNAMKRQG